MGGRDMLRLLLVAASIVIVTFVLEGCSSDKDVAPASMPTSDAGAVTPDSPTPTPLKSPPSQAETFGETLQGDALKWYNSMPQVNRDDIEYFAVVAGHDAAKEWMERSMPESSYGRPPHLTLPLSSFEDALTPDETTKLASLDIRIRQKFVEMWDFGIALRAPIPLPADPKAHSQRLIDERTGELRELLMAIPSTIPSAAEILHTNELAQYQALHPELRELFWVEVATAYAQGLTVARGAFPALNETQVKDLFSQYIPPLVMQGKSCNDHAKPCLKSN